MRTLRTRRLRLDPIGPEHLPFLADLDGDAEVLRHLQPRARTREEALAHWSPRVPGPMWVGHLGEHPVGWWALWPDEGGETASAATVPGLGLLPGRVVFHEDKVLARPIGTWRGHHVEGYEIHHGVVEPTGGEDFPGGHAVGPVRGSIWHGTLECDDYRRALLDDVAATVGARWSAEPGAAPFAARREGMIDILADALETHVDVDAIIDLTREKP